MRKIFIPTPGVSFKSTKNLKSHLVQSNVYPLVRDLGSTKCQNKRYHVCYNVKRNECFQSYHFNTEYKINHKFQCNDKCLVNLITCKFCWKHIQQTVDRLRLCLNNYEENNREAEKGLEHKKAYLFNHFKTE